MSDFKACPNQHSLECKCYECEMYYKEEIEKLLSEKTKEAEIN